jgi:hypothetical protein
MLFARKTFQISKRQRFISISIILWIVIITIYQLSNLGAISIFFLILITYILTYLAIREDISGIEYLTLFIIPISYTLGTLLFLQTLPDRKLYRYPILISYPIVMYVIYLTNNIFNVAAIRTIQLLRAARAVSYLLTLTTLFFIISYLNSQQFDVFSNICLQLITVFLITLQFYWTFELREGVGKKTLIYTSAVTLLMLQLITLFKLTPITPAFSSLIVLTFYYVILGISTHYLEKKLSTRITVEYIIIAILVSGLIFTTIGWR